MSDTDPTPVKLFTFQSRRATNVNMRWADLSTEIKNMSLTAVKLRLSVKYIQLGAFFKKQKCDFIFGTKIKQK